MTDTVSEEEKVEEIYEIPPEVQPLGLQSCPIRPIQAHLDSLLEAQNRYASSAPFQLPATQIDFGFVQDEPIYRETQISRSVKFDDEVDFDDCGESVSIAPSTTSENPLYAFHPDEYTFLGGSVASSMPPDIIKWGRVSSSDARRALHYNVKNEVLCKRGFRFRKLWTSRVVTLTGRILRYFDIESIEANGLDARKLKSAFFHDYFRKALGEFVLNSNTRIIADFEIGINHPLPTFYIYDESDSTSNPVDAVRSSMFGLLSKIGVYDSHEEAHDIKLCSELGAVDVTKIWILRAESNKSRDAWVSKLRRTVELIKILD